MDAAKPVPLLSNVTYPIGAMTQAGFGQVRLSSQPGAWTGKGGLGLLAAGKTASSWTIAQTGGTAGHWAIGSATLTTTPTTLAEGPAALTPTPTAAGVAAGLNGGPYTFAVTCKATDGSKGAATLTITIVPNAASFGDNDALGSLAVVGGSASAFQGAGGNLLLYSVGANRTAGRNGIDLGFSGATIVGSISGTTLTVTSTTSGTLTAGLSLVGLNLQPGTVLGSQISPTTWNVTPSQTAASCTIGAGVTMQHADPTRPGLIWEMEFSAPTKYLNVYGIVCSDGNANTSPASDAHWFSGVSDIVLQDCGATFQEAEVEPAGYGDIRIDDASNLTFNRHTSMGVDQGLVTSGENGGANNVTFNNFTVRYFYNNAVLLHEPASNFTFNDFICLSPMVAASAPQHIDSFQISDNPNSNIVNLTINRAFVFQADGTAYMQGLPFNGFGQGWQVNGSIQVHKAVNGTIFAGMDTTTRPAFFKNFTEVLALTGKPSGADFTGGISNGVLTVSSTPTASDPSSSSSIQVGDFIAPQSTGIFVSSSSIAAYGTGGTTGTGGTGTYSIPGSPDVPSGTALVSGSDASWNVGPVIGFRPSDVAANWTGAAGSFSFSSGFSYSGAPVGIPSSGSGTGPVPALVDVQPSVIAGNNTTSPGGQQAFTVADPRGALEAITPAQWAAMSVHQVVSTVCANLLPKAGGPLDATGGNWYGALTASGQWNDGSGITP